MRVCEGLLKDRVKNNDLLISATILDSRSPAVIEAYHAAGYDMVLIDREHSALNEETIADLVRVARCLGFPVMVRVAEDCYHELNRTLDQGPDGIFVPRIRSREQVEKLVQMVKYKPLGMRGLAGSSCPIGKYSGWTSPVEQIEAVNRNTVVGIQIETVEALNNLDDILSVEGVDMAVVGNDDLSIGMGIPGQTNSPEYIAAVERIFEACRRHNVLPGIAVGGPESTIYWVNKGAKVIWYTCDIYMLLDTSRRELGQIRANIK
ncbi:MAG: HpcH/HpaI aldolase family protein [Armatimonadota bacterium]